MGDLRALHLAFATVLTIAPVIVKMDHERDFQYLLLQINFYPHRLRSSAVKQLAHLRGPQSSHLDCRPCR